MAPLFSTFPDEAPLWIYAAPRTLTDDEQRTVLATLEGFLDVWASHGRPVRGEALFLHDRFLAVAGEVVGGDLSGCGIDASVHAVETAIRAVGLHWLSSLDVLYRAADGSVQALSRPAFRAMVNAGDITTETPVFDLSLQTVGALRAGRFERVAGATWHAGVFHIPAG